MARRPRAEEETPSAPSAAAWDVPPPRAIRITHLHSFHDEDGVHRKWPAGLVVDDPETVAMLLARGAPHEVA